MTTTSGHDPFKSTGEVLGFAESQMPPEAGRMSGPAPADLIDGTGPIAEEQPNAFNEAATLGKKLHDVGEKAIEAAKSGIEKIKDPETAGSTTVKRAAAAVMVAGGVATVMTRRHHTQQTTTQKLVGRAKSLTTK